MKNKSEIVLPNGEVQSICDVLGYKITSEGIFNAEDETIKLSSLCWVDARITFIDGDGVYRVIKGINDTTGSIFELHMSNAEFIADYKSSLISQIVNKGVEIEFGEHKKIMAYLAKQKPSKHIIAVRQIGWHKGLDGKLVYVRPDVVFGNTEPPITLLSSDNSVVHKSIFKSCTIEDEQKFVSNFCSGNPLPIFAMGIGFASLMLRLLDIEGGGFHFFLIWRTNFFPTSLFQLFNKMLIYLYLSLIIFNLLKGPEQYR